MTLRPYPEYKDSGAPWVEDIPAHWQMKRAKTLFQKMERPVRDFDEVVTCFRDGVVTLRKNRRTEGFTNSLKEIGYQGIRKGDLVIHQMDAFAGAVGVSDSDGKGTPVYSVCQPVNDANQYYYAYIVREMARSQWITSLATGIRERSTDFRYNTFAMQFIPFPPPDEQAAIVAFLDAAEQRIRRYIRAKQKLIALLNEQKQAIIQQAVTRGLNPDVPMKDSGVEWLGVIPAHWELIPNRGLFTIKKSIVGSRSSEYDLLSLTLRGIILRDLENVQGKFPANFDTYQVVEPGDFVFCFFDVDETPRTVGLSKHRGMITGAYTVMETTNLAPSRYLYYYYLSLDERKALKPIYRGLRKTIPINWFLAAKSPYPPFKEQVDIVSLLDSVMDRIQPVIDSLQLQINLIQEYRTRLIADVVTGKVDVRGLVFELPEDFADEDLPAVDLDDLLADDGLEEIEE